MLLLRLFLLVMLIDYSESAERVVSRIVSNCGVEMTCFVQEDCTNPAADNIATMVKLRPNTKIVDDCDAIVKIRSYSTRYYLIVLESYNTKVTTIKIDQSQITATEISTIFECKRDNANKVSVESSEPDNIVTEKRTNYRPLSCEFFVRNTKNDVFGAPHANVKLIAVTTTSLEGDEFHIACKPTCDPDPVISSAIGAVGDKTVIKPDVNLDKLVCKDGYTLASSQDGIKFDKVSSITCKKSTGGFAFEPKLTKARCEVDTCTQCPVLPNFDTHLEGGCTKLRCKDKHMKVGSTIIKEGLAECKFVQDNHVWQVNGLILTSSDKCVEKKRCFENEDDVKKACTNCKLGPDNIPMCASGATLKYRTEPMEIKCNDVTGVHSYMYQQGPIDSLPEDGRLHCDRVSSGGDSVLPYVLGAIIGILLLEL